MPLCTLFLIALHKAGSDPLQTFLSTLQSSNTSPLLVSRVIRWIILPSSLSAEELLSRNIHWDVLLILPSSVSVPPSLQALIEHQWSVTAGVPSSLTKDFAFKNKSLLHPAKGTVPPRSYASEGAGTLSSSQDLELSSELQTWIHDFHSSSGSENRGAVSMLNLLSFGPQLKSSYLEYGRAFATSVGIKHGGTAKIVGTVVSVNGKKKDADEGWDEIAVAHYPSITHFADMLASPDYQRVNKKYRLPALKDTCILFTSEMRVGEMMSQQARNAQGKL